LVTVTAATIAPLGWAFLPAAVTVLIATTAAVLRVTLGLLNDDDR
jgi:hypothetical protein